MRLRFTSCQAPCAEAFGAEVARFVGEQLGMPTEFVRDIPWQARERAFDRGAIDVCWMCGWPYALRAEHVPVQVELIAARVMEHPRYLGEPVYFSDVVVRADSRFTSFDDLRGAAWAYNEPMSHSGYVVVRHYMTARKIRGAFFGSVVESGSHQASIDLILDGAVDAAAIDTTVLETMLRQRLELKPALRVVDTLGPSPAPPWVMRASLPSQLREGLREQFATMHETSEGRAILERSGVKRFAVVGDHHYDPIRKMAVTAEYAYL